MFTQSKSNGFRFKFVVVNAARMLMNADVDGCIAVVSWLPQQLYAPLSIKKEATSTDVARLRLNFTILVGAYKIDYYRYIELGRASVCTRVIHLATAIAAAAAAVLFNLVLYVCMFVYR